MFINYRRLFNLRLHHNYYLNGNPDGIELRPTSDTLKKLHGGNMLLKKIPNGVTVLYRAGGDGSTPVVPLEELKLRFAISVHDDAQFQTITELDESPSKKYTSTSVLLFRNDPAKHSEDKNQPEKLSHVLIDSVENSLFTFSIKPEDPPETLIFSIQNDRGDPVSPGKDTNGKPLPDQITLSQLEDGSFSQQVDLRGRKPGFYRLSVHETETDNNPLIIKKIFVDEELSGKKLMGILELTCGTSEGELYDEIQEYSLRFKRRESFWKYLIVNKYGKITSPDELEIEDKGADSSDHYTATSFSRIDPGPDETVNINGLETIRFRSADPIPFFEVPRPQVQLKKTDGIVFIQHLPNPSPSASPKLVEGQPESEIYVYI
jgi:hypothetical protein